MPTAVPCGILARLQSIHGLDSSTPRGICLQSSLLWRNELPVLYLFSTQLSLADALSTMFRGISLPKEEVLVEYTCHFVG
jgi:hypothetical protein